MSQSELFEGERKAPEDIVAEARAAEGEPCRRFCLLSGGHDSTTCATRCRSMYDELAFIDTGTALPGVREFVVAFAEHLGKPLRIFDAGGAYRELILGDRAWWAFFKAEKGTAEPLAGFVRRTTPDRTRGDGLGNAPQGFPGPAGGHRAAYSRLKERSIERLTREAKAEHAPGDRGARVMLLSGARKFESRRRSMTQGVEGFRRRNAQVWVNPLNDWRNEEVLAFRRERRIPESDVSALLHRSGECNCGAYMSGGELAEVLSLFRDWHRRLIVPLENICEELGIPRRIWGERTDTGRPGARGFDLGRLPDTQIALNFDNAGEEVEEGPMCSSCAPGETATGVR